MKNYILKINRNWESDFSEVNGIQSIYELYIKEMRDDNFDLIGESFKLDPKYLVIDLSLSMLVITCRHKEHFDTKNRDEFFKRLKFFVDKECEEKDLLIGLE